MIIYKLDSKKLHRNGFEKEKRNGCHLSALIANNGNIIALQFTFKNEPTIS